jgi:Fic family protein
MTHTQTQEHIDRERIKLATKASILEQLELTTDDLISTTSMIDGHRDSKAAAKHLAQIIEGYVKLTQRIQKELRAK